MFFCDHEDDNADNMMICHAAAVTVGGNTGNIFHCWYVDLIINIYFQCNYINN